MHSEVTSYHLAKGYWSQILAMLHHRKYSRILIEKDIEQRLAAHDVFDIVSEIAHSGCNGISFAIFDHFYDAEKCHFEDMAGTNRGLRVRILNDFPALESWLMSQPTEMVTRDSRPHLTNGANLRTAPLLQRE